MPRTPTKEKVKKTLLQVLDRKLTAEHYKVARAFERKRLAWDRWGILTNPTSLAHPLVACWSIEEVRKCTAGCILQKAYVRLEKQLAERSPDPLTHLTGVFRGLLPPKKIQRIIFLNDAGHFNKLKKLIEAL